MEHEPRYIAGYDRLGNVQITDTKTGQSVYIQGDDATGITSETSQAELAEYFTQGN